MNLLRSKPFFIRRGRKRGRRALGVKYEARGHEHFQAEFGERYVASPWFSFHDAGELRYCEADGLLFDWERGVITIVEFKYQHTTNAWWQLEHLYEPIIRALFPDWDVAKLEVVKWYDPDVNFPRFKFCANIDTLKNGELGVHIWKP